MTKLANSYIKDKKLIEIDIETFEYSHRDNTTSRVIVPKQSTEKAKKVNQKLMERRTSKRLNAKASSDSVIIEKTVKKHKK